MYVFVGGTKEKNRWLISLFTHPPKRFIFLKYPVPPLSL
jgi:hypothetical protein